MVESILTLHDRNVREIVDVADPPLLD